MSEPAPTIAPLGDSALLVTFGDRIDPGLNERAHDLAAAVERMRADDQRFGRAVPAYASVLVPFDPVAVDPEEARRIVAALVDEAPQGARTGEAGTLVEIPVRYGGDDGPDLDDVAALNDLRPDDVVELHAGVEYRVFFLGFAPGFAYLGPVPAQIATPRLDAPRQRVAGRQRRRSPASRPASTRSRCPAAGGSSAGRMSRCGTSGATPLLSSGRRSGPLRPESVTLEVLEPGLLTPIQDAGRPDWTHLGVPIGGACDPWSLAVANLLVGNDAGAAAARDDARRRRRSRSATRSRSGWPGPTSAGSFGRRGGGWRRAGHTGWRRARRSRFPGRRPGHPVRCPGVPRAAGRHRRPARPRFGVDGARRGVRRDGRQAPSRRRRPAGGGHRGRPSLPTPPGPALADDPLAAAETDPASVAPRTRRRAGRDRRDRMDGRRRERPRRAAAGGPTACLRPPRASCCPTASSRARSSCRRAGRRSSSSPITRPPAAIRSPPSSSRADHPRLGQLRPGDTRPVRGRDDRRGARLALAQQREALARGAAALASGIRVGRALAVGRRVASRR